MHRFLPRIPGFHPLPPPGHARIAQDARYALLGRLQVIERLIPLDQRRTLLPLVLQLRQALQRSADNARTEYGPRLSGTPREPHPGERTGRRRPTPDNPLAQIEGLLDPQILRGLEAVHDRAVDRLRAAVRRALVDTTAPETDPEPVP